MCTASLDIPAKSLVRENNIQLLIASRRVVTSINSSRRFKKSIGPTVETRENRLVVNVLRRFYGSHHQSGIVGRRADSCVLSVPTVSSVPPRSTRVPFRWIGGIPIKDKTRKAGVTTVCTPIAEITLIPDSRVQSLSKSRPEKVLRVQLGLVLEI